MTDPGCPFCAPAAERIFHAGRMILGLWDAFPVSPGHALLVPKRHVASWFDASGEEQLELVAAIEFARREIEKAHRPDGFNVGVNIGLAGGQTVPHLHVHVIPRYAGDVADPRGGVRYVIPSRANYLASPIENDLLIADREPDVIASELGDDLPHTRALIAGGEDPLLPHVRAHIDRAESADLAVAFLLQSGLHLLREHLRDLLERRGRLRIVTGTYLGVTDPNALLELLDLKGEFPNQVDLRVFEAYDQSFHPKAYLFHHRSTDGVALVGSSNLTSPALTNGVEWNFRTISSRDRMGFTAVTEAFERLLGHPRVRLLDADWVSEYRQARMPEPVPAGIIPEPPLPPPEPHEIQKRALHALEATRAAGNTAGLVVLATGLGKTWLSAFDSQRAAFRRVLFVAHRDEILHQALSTYRRIRPEAHLGLYTGQEKTANAEVVFASIQTLSRKAHLDRFAPDEFDYLIVDEFHHASARTYRRVIDHFEPKFLLGLTATPERTDGGDLLALCQENLVFRCDVAEGIQKGLLSPFHYFGVPDEVNYENIPWRSSRFDEDALTEAVATRSRAQNALEQYRARGGTRTLAFCCSQRHADFMRDFFRVQGVRSAAVHSGPKSDPRAASLERLKGGELEVLFAVDIFNEGVDLPEVDTVMMLRPTESRILWLQQFGRGLRKAEGKERLTVIDYIGNHRSFLLKPQTLFELPSGDRHLADQLTRLERGQVDLPPGCRVTYELETIDILRSLLRRPGDEDAIRFFYEDFRERYGIRPTASEMHHERYRPRSVRSAYGSWLGFVRAMGDLTPAQQNLLAQGRPAEFLSTLEVTPMTRSYKMLVLLALLHAGRMPGQISVEELREGIRRLARRSAALQRDLGAALEDDASLDRMLREDPIAAWTGGKGTGGIAYFEFRDGALSTSFDVDPSQREMYAELVREIADWRLAEYLDRSSPGDGKPHLEPLPHLESPAGLELGRSYMRADIPAAFGLQFNSNLWQQGFVFDGSHIFLLVTLDKSGLPQHHQYGDRFLSREILEWKSQNRHSQEGSAGQAIRHHVERGIAVHLLVRKAAKIGGRGAPFIYCGDVEFVDWEGEKPITVRWRLVEPLNERLSDLFAAPPVRAS